jgi:hypothetical protein
LMDSVTGASRRQLARIAGALYLINVVGGAFAIGWKRSPVVAPMRRVFESVSRLVDHLTIGSLFAIRDLDPRFMAQEELEELICLAEVLKPSA